MSLLKKIQNLPEIHRKIILWTSLFILGAGLFIFWLEDFQNKLRNLKKEEIIKELEVPAENFKGMPKFEMPESAKEELKKLEDAIKEATTTMPQQ